MAPFYSENFYKTNILLTVQEEEVLLTCGFDLPVCNACRSRKVMLKVDAQGRHGHYLRFLNIESMHSNRHRLIKVGYLLPSLSMVTTDGSKIYLE